MAGGNHRRRQFDMRDINPHVLDPRAQQVRRTEGQKRAFFDGSESSGELMVVKHKRPFGQRAVIVELPNSPGTEVIIPKNAGIAAFRKDQKILAGAGRSGLTALGEAPAGERGTANFTADVGVTTSSIFLLTHMSPSIFDPGDSVVVSFFGAGFSQSPVDILTSPDPLVTIGVVTFVSTTEVTALVTIDPTHSGAYFSVDFNRA